MHQIQRYRDQEPKRGYNHRPRTVTITSVVLSMPPMQGALQPPESSDNAGVLCCSNTKGVLFLPAVSRTHGGKTMSCRLSTVCTPVHQSRRSIPYDSHW